MTSWCEGHGASPGHPLGAAAAGQPAGGEPALVPEHSNPSTLVLAPACTSPGHRPSDVAGGPLAGGAPALVPGPASMLIVPHSC